MILASITAKLILMYIYDYLSQCLCMSLIFSDDCIDLSNNFNLWQA